MKNGLTEPLCEYPHCRRIVMLGFRAAFRCHTWDSLWQKFWFVPLFWPKWISALITRGLCLLALTHGSSGPALTECTGEDKRNRDSEGWDIGRQNREKQTDLQERLEHARKLTCFKFGFKSSWRAEQPCGTNRQPGWSHLQAKLTSYNAWVFFADRLGLDKAALDVKACMSRRVWDIFSHFICN